MGLETGWIRTSGRVSRWLLGTFAWKEAKFLKVECSLLVESAFRLLGIGGANLWVLRAVGRRHERSQTALELSGSHSAKCI